MKDMDSIFPEEQTMSKENNNQTKRESSKEPKMPTDIFHQLQYIQQKLVVGKTNVNHQLNASMKEDSFPYRTLEDIYSELKPILAKVDCVLTTQVKPVCLNNFFFAEATVVLENAKGERREVVASAMMNLKADTYKYPAQETAACGTMAIKSALGALFLLDNTTKEKQADMVTTEMSALPQPGHTAAAPQGNAAKKTAPAATKTNPTPAAQQSGTSQPPQNTNANKPAAVTSSNKPKPASVGNNTAGRQSTNKEKYEKPELTKDSNEWHHLGVNASTKFKGTREELITSIKSRFKIDDDVAEEFANCFWNNSAAA